MAGPAARVWHSDGKSGVGEVLTLVSELTSQCGKVPFPAKSSLSDSPGPTRSLCCNFQSFLVASQDSQWGGSGGLDYYKDDEENPLKTTWVTIQ